jgi:hypothetical protein
MVNIHESKIRTPSFPGEAGGKREQIIPGGVLEFIWVSIRKEEESRGVTVWERISVLPSLDRMVETCSLQLRAGLSVRPPVWCSAALSTNNADYTWCSLDIGGSALHGNSLPSPVA